MGELDDALDRKRQRREQKAAKAAVWSRSIVKKWDPVIQEATDGLVDVIRDFIAFATRISAWNEGWIATDHNGQERMAWYAMQRIPREPTPEPPYRHATRKERKQRQRSYEESVRMYPARRDAYEAELIAAGCRQVSYVSFAHGGYDSDGFEYSVHDFAILRDGRIAQWQENVPHWGGSAHVSKKALIDWALERDQEEATPT